MSWKKFSSNNNRKGVAENNSKQKSSIYASKVFTDNIIVNNQADVGEIDFPNLNFTKDIYKSDSINILEFMHGTDISVNQIGVQNNVDTSGVVKIIKPIKAYVGLFNKLKGYDASFERLNVNTVNVKNINSIYDGSQIEIASHVIFNDIVDFEDISMNHFNLNTNNEVIISADISISTQDKSLKFKDASINSLGSRSGTNIIRFDKDISLNGSIFSIGVSADELIVSDMSVNIIEAKDTSVNITNDISVNGNINIDKINLDFIVSDVSIQSDLSINGDLLCNTMKIDGNFGKLDNNTFLEFTDTVSFEKTLVKSDISATTITFNTGSNKVPTTEIIPDNPKNIITYGLNSYRDNSCIVIDGDVSINGKLDAEWDKTGMNIIPTLTSNLDLIKNIDDYEIGQFVILKIGTNEKIFIKSGEKSWHNLVIGNASPFYTKFLLKGTENEHIFINNPGYETILSDNSYTDLNGLEGTVIVFYVEKTYYLSNEIFTLDISHNDPEDEAIISFFDNSISNYLGGAGWGISLENAPDTTSGTDISVVKIQPPINNGFDFSMTVTIQEDRLANVVPIEQKVIFKKKNDIPEWEHMILEISNNPNNPISNSQQSWNKTIQSPPNNQTIIDKDASYTFDVHYYNPSIYANDTSYYILDLSALDREKFDVSYRVKAGKDDYHVNDWSWNWVSQEAHKIQIKIPGVGYNETDFSLEILAHDNSIPDVSNLIPESYYTDTIDASKRIVKFQKINTQPEWNHIRLDASNNNLLLRDQSWNTTSNPPIQNGGDLSNQFYLYFDSCKNYVYSNGITDLSSYYLDLSALDFEGFDVSYDVSNVKGDLSWAWVDNSRIVIDISDTAELGSDTSLQIISIDDWIDRPNPEERIVKFKHISSQVVYKYTLELSGQADLELLYDDFSFNNIYKFYTYDGDNGDADDISLIFNHRDDINRDSVNLQIIENITTTYSDPNMTSDTDTTEATIFGNTVYISNRVLGLLSVNILFNSIFKYKFQIRYDNSAFFHAHYILPVNIYGNDGGGEYIIITTNSQDIEQDLRPTISYYGFTSFTITTHAFGNPGYGGNGGQIKTAWMSANSSNNTSGHKRPDVTNTTKWNDPSYYPGQGGTPSNTLEGQGVKEARKYTLFYSHYQNEDYNFAQNGVFDVWQNNHFYSNPLLFRMLNTPHEYSFPSPHQTPATTTWGPYFNPASNYDFGNNPNTPWLTKPNISGWHGNPDKELYKDWYFHRTSINPSYIGRGTSLAMDNSEYCDGPIGEYQFTGTRTGFAAKKLKWGFGFLNYVSGGGGGGGASSLYHTATIGETTMIKSITLKMEINNNNKERASLNMDGEALNNHKWQFSGTRISSSLNDDNYQQLQKFDGSDGKQYQNTIPDDAYKKIVGYDNAAHRPAESESIANVGRQWYRHDATTVPSALNFSVDKGEYDNGSSGGSYTGSVEADRITLPDITNESSELAASSSGQGGVRLGEAGGNGGKGAPGTWWTHKHRENNGTSQIFAGLISANNWNGRNGETGGVGDGDGGTINSPNVSKGGAGGTFPDDQLDSALKTGMDKLYANYGNNTVSNWNEYKKKLNGGSGGDGAPFGPNGLGYESGSTVTDHNNDCEKHLFSYDYTAASRFVDNQSVLNIIGSKGTRGTPGPLTHKVFIVIKKKS